MAMPSASDRQSEIVGIHAPSSILVRFLPENARLKQFINSSENNTLHIASKDSNTTVHWRRKHLVSLFPTKIAKVAGTSWKESS